MTGRASAGGRFRCQNKKRIGQGRHFVGPALSFMDVTAPVPRRCSHRRCRCGMGHRGRRRCRGSLRYGGLSPGGSVLPVGCIGGTGIELQAVLLPLGDVGGGTGHGRPGYRRRSRWAGPDHLREIRRIAGEGGPDCTWDDTTVILLGRPLYGPDDRCNGYVCRLTTGGMETGYLQVDALGGELCTGAHSFTGIPAYEGLAEEGGGTASEERLYFSAASPTA